MSERISYAPGEIPAVTGIAKTRIRDAIASGELPTVPHSPKRVVVLHTDLVAWLERLKQSA